MTKSISLLGSTGSIGVQTLDVARKMGIRVTALAARSNIELLAEQALEFRPALVSVMEEKAAKELKERLASENIRVVCGKEGLCEAATEKEADTVLTAVVGMVGLLPTLEAIKEGKNIALANKETLVAGGELVIEAAKRKKISILPVDSEHSAIFQSLDACKRPAEEIDRILLTASGGPFFGWKREELTNITPAEAVKHPNWSMGAKISIDSATLMNKGLELIEAMHLFGVKPEQIQVLVHRESILHSAVAFTDGSVIGQMSDPDMRLPIQYALTYPYREKSVISPLDLLQIGKLTFASPDTKTFKALELCRKAAEIGGTMPAALNGANEQAVTLFLSGKITFLGIGDLLEKFMQSYQSKQKPSLEDILAADQEARAFIEEAYFAYGK